jgi:hypothetical protein
MGDRGAGLLGPGGRHRTVGHFVGGGLGLGRPFHGERWPKMACGFLALEAPLSVAGIERGTCGDGGGLDLLVHHHRHVDLRKRFGEEFHPWGADVVEGRGNPAVVVVGPGAQRGGFTGDLPACVDYRG